MVTSQKKGKNGCRACGKSQINVEPLTLLWHIDHPPTYRDAQAELNKSNKESSESESSSEEDEDSEDELDSPSEEKQKPGHRFKAKKPSKTKARRPGDDVMGFQPIPERPSRLLGLTDDGPRLPLVGSSKLTAIKETILRWQAEALDDKILGKSYSNHLILLLVQLTLQFLSNTRFSLSALRGCSKLRASNFAHILAMPQRICGTRSLVDSRKTPKFQYWQVKDAFS